MPHKVSPIDPENSEDNVDLANAVLRHLSEKLLASRWQHDLTGSTILRDIGVAFDYSLLAYDTCLRGLGKLEANPVHLAEGLDVCQEVLTEPAQTVMRWYDIANPCEQLKELTRGKGISRGALREFIGTLATPEDARKLLLDITPASHIGKTEEPACRIA